MQDKDSDVASLIERIEQLENAQKQAKMQNQGMANLKKKIERRQQEQQQLEATLRQKDRSIRVFTVQSIMQFIAILLLLYISSQ